MLKRLLGRRAAEPAPAPVWRPGTNEIVCNHYKFKSREEWAARTARLNSAGWLAGKFTAPNMESWEADSNAVERRDILRFLTGLKERLAAPVPPCPFKAPYYCAVLSVFRAEEEHIDEWLAYHAMLGVEQFFLYNNDGDLSNYRRLHEYIAQGWVSLTDWPDSVLEQVPEARRRTSYEQPKNVSVQNLAIRHFCAQQRAQTRWVISIDIDEFMVPLAAPDLPGLLRAHEDCAGIEVPRLHFGSAGHVARPAGTIIENYLRAQAEPSSVKSIAQTRHLARRQRGGPHHFAYAAIKDRN